MITSIRILFSMFGVCDHPSEFLVVDKKETIDKVDADFEYLTYHLQCRLCSKPVKVKYARMIGGVEGFMSRAKQ